MPSSSSAKPRFVLLAIFFAVSSTCVYLWHDSKVTRAPHYEEPGVTPSSPSIADQPLSESHLAALRETVRELSSKARKGATLSGDEKKSLLLALQEVEGTTEFERCISYFPASLIEIYRSQIVSHLQKSLTKLDSEERRRLFSQFLSDLSSTYDPGLAENLLGLLESHQLPVLEPLPPGSNPANVALTPAGHFFANRGVSGSYYSAIVRLADEPIMRTFRQRLAHADSATRNVMLWALGNSYRLTDGKFLLEYAGNADEPVGRKIAQYSVNRVAQFSMTGRINFTKSDVERGYFDHAKANEAARDALERIPREKLELQSLLSASGLAVKITPSEEVYPLVSQK